MFICLVCLVFGLQTAYKIKAYKVHDCNSYLQYFCGKCLVSAIINYYLLRNVLNHMTDFKCLSMNSVHTGIRAGFDFFLKLVRFSDSRVCSQRDTVQDILCL